jgi:DNA repair exonuclease SbcCD ATPase subunit
LEWSPHFPDSRCDYDFSNCHRLTCGRVHQKSNGQARQDDQITRFFTELVEKEANRAEKDRKIEERIKRLEECNNAKEKESATLKALLSQVQRRLGFANADNSAREPTAQAKSNNHPSESAANPMASNATTNTGPRKRRCSIIKTESDEDHKDFGSSTVGKGKKRLRN